MKTHWADNDAPACGRKVVAGTRLSDHTHNVTCLACQNLSSFEEAKFNDDVAREQAFRDQVPHTVVPQFGRVNDDGVMECPWCGGTLWRERPRSLFSYHYVCANDDCGKSVHPMTETGMST